MLPPWTTTAELTSDPRTTTTEHASAAAAAAATAAVVVSAAGFPAGHRPACGGSSAGGSRVARHARQALGQPTTCCDCSDEGDAKEGTRTYLRLPQHRAGRLQLLQGHLCILMARTVERLPTVNQDTSSQDRVSRMLAHTQGSSDPPTCPSVALFRAMSSTASSYT